MKRSPIKRRPRKGIRKYLEARELVAEEAAYRCQANTRRCNGQLEQVHHRKGRDGELLADPKYLLGVCEPCHRYIHEHPAESYERGWMVKRLGSGRMEQEDLRGGEEETREGI